MALNTGVAYEENFISQILSVQVFFKYLCPFFLGIAQHQCSYSGDWGGGGGVLFIRAGGHMTPQIPRCPHTKKKIMLNMKQNGQRKKSYFLVPPTKREGPSAPPPPNSGKILATPPLRRHYNQLKIGLEKNEGKRAWINKFLLLQSHSLYCKYMPAVAGWSSE